jgi:hypothetical protein
MNNKFYITLEAARLLKEKGYDRECDYHIEEVVYGNMTKEQAEKLETKFPCPTKAEAIDWLDSKGIVVELSYDDQAHIDNARWQYFIYTHDNDGWVEALVCGWHENDFYPTRLETEEAAIIKALELL